MFPTLLKREFKLLYKKKAELLQLLVFLLLSLLILPLAIGPERKLLTTVAGGYIWIIQLFMVFSSLKLFFEDDYKDGSLEQLLLQVPSPSLIIMAKYAAYSLNLALISLLSLPFFALLFQIAPENLAKTAATLLIGVPCLAVIGGFAAALTLGAKKSGVIAPIILIPLYTPVLIFAVGGGDFYSSIAMLAALFLLTAPLSIFFSSLALKISVRG